MINTFKNQKHHPGFQPIRVLSQNIVHSFENVDPEFKKEATEFISSLGMKNRLAYKVGEEPIYKHDETPRIGGEKEIKLYETYFSYLWIVCYTLFVSYYEFVYKPIKHRSFQNINLNEISRTLKLFEYGMSLLYTYEPWDKKNHPNPELYKEEDKFYIEASNHAYQIATTYILYHEYSHAKLGHIDNYSGSNIIIEKEADENAFNMLIRGMTDHDKKLNIALGVISGLCSLLLTSPISNSRTHPDSLDRIKDFIEKLKLDNNDSLWSIPCFTLRLWDLHYHIGFEWGDNDGTYKDLFYRIYNQ